MSASGVRIPGRIAAKAAEAAPGFPQPIRLTPAASGYLDATRAIAALAVLLGHWRALYFVDFGNVKAPFAGVKLLYLITGFGHQAVMIFFVLSGFFIGSSVFRKAGRDSWSWGDYAIDRGARLYTVLIPGLLLGLLWDWLGIHFLDSRGIYSHPLIPFADSIPVHGFTAAAWLGNVLFLQSRFTPVFGSNVPLWSLFNEFWYYVLFPALVTVFLCMRRGALLKAAGAVLAAVFASWMLGAQLSGFVVWLAGCAVALSARHLRFSARARGRLWLYIGAAGALFSFSLWRARESTLSVGHDLAVGLSCAVLLHGILQLPLSLPAAAIRLAHTFAGFSFSLYVLHFPLLLLIRARWLAALRWQPDLRHLLYGTPVAIGVAAYAYAVAHLTENNTAAVRAWIRRGR